MDFLITSTRILLEISDTRSELVTGGILISSAVGTIKKLLCSQYEVNSWIFNHPRGQVIDYGSLVIIPGLIDPNVHISEPGRPDWEGFETITKAAASGGVTTIVDMPTNNIPTSTSLENLKMKINYGRNKIYVDCAFWGGAQSNNHNEIYNMIDYGVIGVYCTLCDNDLIEYPSLSEYELEKVMKLLEGSDTVLVCHPEAELYNKFKIDENNLMNYNHFLESKPDAMEVKGVQIVTRMAKKFNIRLHIQQLSSVECLPVIQEARENGLDVTAETCFHYLTIPSQEIDDAQTQYKCAPPIRSNDNRIRMWRAVRDGEINLLASSHNPATPEDKGLVYGRDRGNFFTSWPGVASLQLGLSLFWTNCEGYSMNLHHMVKLLSKAPAKLCGLSRSKGKIAPGYDADFCIFDPEEYFMVTPDIIEFKNKMNPYLGKRLKGRVHATILRGYIVYQIDEKFTNPLGQIILNKVKRKNKKKVKFFK